MKRILFYAVLVWGLMECCAFAQGVPPTQTINTNQGISCNAIGSGGAVNLCRPGWSYGCASNTTSNQILGTDGNRTSIQFQNTGANPIVLVFGDAANGNNGFIVYTGQPYFWTNLNQGNVPGRINTAAISINSNGASTCAFMFTD
jgi:hypothetical protein